MNILEFITEKPITRHELSDLTGLNDRQVREAIEQARSAGTVIINLQDGKGYFLSDDPAILKKQKQLNDRRAKSILIQQKFINRKLKGA